MGHLPVLVLISVIQVCFWFAYHVVWTVLRVAWRSLQGSSGEGDPELPHTSLAYLYHGPIHRFWKGHRSGSHALHSPSRASRSIPLVLLILSIQE